MATHSYSKEAGRKGHLKFEKERTKQLNIRLNDRTDADVIEFLDSLNNKRGYILDLIRSDMARRKAGE